MALVGFTVPANRVDHQRCAQVFEAVDYLEVVPESLVEPRDLPVFAPNGYFRRVLDLQQRLGVPVVAHGTGLSVCSNHPLDGPRFGRWIERAAAMADRLDLQWYTDHAGVTAPAGLNLTLPLDVPHSRAAQNAARARLSALAEAVGVPVGIENSVYYAPMADPKDEPRWLRTLLGEAHVLVLDVHNLWTHAVNFGIDIDDWLAEAPLDRVIEVHVSGGTLADARWTNGAPWRLDSHDDAVPEPVWALLQRVIPRCPALRGVTLERLEGTIAEADVPGLLEEVDRIRSILLAAPPPSRGPESVHPECSLPGNDDEGAVELRLADAWSSRDPQAALQQIADDPEAPGWVRQAVGFALAHPAGVGICRRLILRQRFERLIHGSAEAERWFETDPASFARAFIGYAAATPPVAYLPVDEAMLFERWVHQDAPG
ncbi:MAG: DUF692 family multinuclear iron-containing protein [Myxococcota bacterium]